MTGGLAAVQARIADAAFRAGRKPDEIRLVVVTKGRRLEEIKAVLAQGVVDIGENRVLEAHAKWKALSSGVGNALSSTNRYSEDASLDENIPIFHMVGHLQRNKVSKALEFVRYIHSLDSLALAEDIAKRTTSVQREGSTFPFSVEGSSCSVGILVEVNVTGEPQKHGIAPETTRPFVEKVLELGIRPLGLMCMSKQGATPDEHAKYFGKLARIRDDLIETVDPCISELSMGMSDDFEVAISAGATMVRIGRAIFEPDTS
ncbi:MAG: YggS family pyridoxal phosphate enzyme [Acidimicrobiia bacterium]